ncbi:MAG: ATP phosphoribosyltransferase [Sphaerochaetaceae bacterium]
MERLKIAIQRSGRLCSESLKIIRNCGIEFTSPERILKEKADNFPIEFLYVRDDDIPFFIKDNVADIGIVGSNEFLESGLDLKIVRDLGFAKCRLSIAVPKGFEYKNLKSLEGKRIATSYPNILKKVLKEAEVKASFVKITGSVEITPAIGISDVICDLVSTGTTLTMNGLTEVEPIYYSSAVMIANSEMAPEKKEILDRLLLRIDAVSLAKNNKYVMFNLPEKHLEQVASIVGGVKSPTITKLMEKGWLSVQLVVSEDKFWEVFEKLKELGAQGILVTPIEKMTL